jgi:hypothetical protein
MPRAANTPHRPLAEVSPNTPSRVVGSRGHGIKFGAISRLENLTDATCRSMFKNASHQTSCVTPARPGRPTILTEGDKHLISREIVLRPKITAQ